MNAIWEAILTRENNEHFDFCQPPTKINKVLVPLSNYSCIEILGKDAEKFLQGQLSNDVSKLKNKSWQLSAYCNHKGRIIAFIWLGLYDGHYFLCLPSESKAICLMELRKFGAFSNVEIREANHLKLIGSLGQLEEKIKNNAFLCMDFIGILPLSLLLYEENNLMPLQELSCFHSTEVWDYGNIINELPIIRREQQERFTPHQLNLQNKHVISLKKGCYRGQEIIARMHYLGKLKQSLYKIKLESKNISLLLESVPKTLEMEDGQVAGEIVNLLDIKNGGYLGLAVLNKSTIPNTEPVIIPLKNMQTLRVIE